MNEKKSKIVQTAGELFSRYGIRRVTVEEICRQAAVSKMTFYKHFKNKIELVRFVFEKIFEKAERQFDMIINDDCPFTEKVKNIIRLKEEQTQKYSQEFLNDWIFVNDPELQNLLEKKTLEIQQRTIRFFEQARKKGEIAKETNLQFVLYMMRHLSEMLKDKELLSIYPDRTQAIMELTRYFFYGILPGEHK